MKYDDLGNRMKGYENISRVYLTKRMPVIVRIDGKAFHTFTHGFVKPFDTILVDTMQETAKYLCENISGCKLAYIQSDEISLLLTDYDTLNTQPWFDNNLQKLVSVAASMTTLAFNKAFTKAVWHHSEVEEKLCKTYQKAMIQGAMFDARAFIIPKEEVCNYFIWRQQDATRNSIQMVGRANFSNKQLDRKSCADIMDMLMLEKGINWNDTPTRFKRGSCVIKKSSPENPRKYWVIDYEIPIFTKDRVYIEQCVNIEEVE